MFSLFSDPFYDPFYEDQHRLMNLLRNSLDEEDEKKTDKKSPKTDKQVQKKNNELSQNFFWTPRCDLHETKDNFVIQAELPGIPKENIKINIEDGVLTISGKKESMHETSSDEKDEDKPIYHRMERTYGSFKRSYALPDNVLTDGIKADSKDGVLSITLPKRPVEPKKTIAITIN